MHSWAKVPNPPRHAPVGFALARPQTFFNVEAKPDWRGLNVLQTAPTCPPLANVALAISCRDRDKEKIREGNGFFIDKAEIDCKREQECFPDLFQNNWDGSYDTCYERTYDPDEAEYLVESMKCSYDSEAGKECVSKV